MHSNDSHWADNFIVQALLGNDITMNGGTRQTRSFYYLNDHIDLIVEISNLTELSAVQFAEIVLKLSGSKSKIIHQAPPSDYPKQCQFHIERVKAKLLWEPRVNIGDGLKKAKAIAYLKKVAA